MDHPGDPVEVRPARVDEYDEVGALVEAAYRAGRQLEGGHGYERVLRDVADRARSAQVLVAVRGSRLVGSVTLMEPHTEYSEMARDGEAEFRFLAVHPSAWGTGVADALVRACLEWAGARPTVICTRAGNDPAVALYRRHGFVLTPDRDFVPVPEVHLLALVHPGACG